MTVATTVLPELLPFYPFWELQLYKVGDCWAFDLPEYGVTEELLVGGTESILDKYYYELYLTYAKEGDTLRVRIYNGDRITPELYKTTLHLLSEDPDYPGSHYYTDSNTGDKAWFCPFLLTLWGEAPRTIHVDFKL